MKFNEELAEKPDHGHYPVCLGRKLAIDSFCRSCFFYTAGVCLLMIILTMFTVRFNVISWIPNLIGDGTSVGANLLQTLILLLMVLMSALATGKYKIFNIFLFIIYFIMAFSCFFTHSVSDTFTFFIGAVGCGITFRSLNAYLDYRQLTVTEGFPFFNERLAEQDENSTFVSRYEEEYHKTEKVNMAEPEKNVSQPAAASDNSAPEMESLETAAVPENHLSEGATAAVYAPRHEKYCAMSESPHQLSQSGFRG